MYLYDSGRADLRTVRRMLRLVPSTIQYLIANRPVLETPPSSFLVTLKSGLLRAAAASTGTRTIRIPILLALAVWHFTALAMAYEYRSRDEYSTVLATGYEFQIFISRVRVPYSYCIGG